MSIKDNYKNPTNNTCISLIELFQCKKANLRLFNYDINSDTIYINEKAKTDKELHTQVFEELNIITNKLNEIECDYSINTNGDLLLNCAEKYCSCDNSSSCI